jgi:signal transduction histidine kinase
MIQGADASEGSIEALRAAYRELLARIEASDRDLQRLVRSSFRAQEGERRRIARDLHDGIGQNLTALKHRLGLLLEAAPEFSEDSRAALSACIDLCVQTLAETRQMSRLLRPQVLDDLGLHAALRWLARTVGQAGALEVALELGELPELEGERQTVLFRVAQEALSNCLKHAQARQAGLRLAAHGQWISLEVWDDGRGFAIDPLAASNQAEGSGLSGLRERARAYGGRLHLDSAPGTGTRLRLMLPARESGAPA